jgi:hypothetical protein
MGQRETSPRDRRCDQVGPLGDALPCVDDEAVDAGADDVGVCSLEGKLRESASAYRHVSWGLDTSRNLPSLGSAQAHESLAG